LSLENRLDASVSHHKICAHVLTSTDFVELNQEEELAELLTLEGAFNIASDHALWKTIVAVIRSELEIGDTDEQTMPIQSREWNEIINGGWDFTLWCFWIYTLFLLRTSGSDLNLPTHLKVWIDSMMAIYNAGEAFEGRASQEFRGDKDELETLEHMIDHVTQWFVTNGVLSESDSARYLEGGDQLRSKLINLASTVAVEEGLHVDVMDKASSGSGRGTSRQKQRVLCIL